MSTGQASRRARFLTTEAFARFLQWLSPDNIEEAASRYLYLRTKLVSFFVRKGCTHAEELADRTLDRVAAIVQEEAEKYSTPLPLCFGVARNVWMEYLRAPEPEVLEPDKIPAPTHPDLHSECEEKCLGSCLDELSRRDRDLITQYHQFQGSQKIETRKRLAQELGGLNKLRITTYRIRVRLHACISGCVQRSAIHERHTG